MSEEALIKNSESVMATDCGIRDFILNAIRESNCTTSWIAKKSGVARSTIISWLNGAIPTLDNATYVLIALGYTVVVKEQQADES